jgi:hypothetical protein
MNIKRPDEVEMVRRVRETVHRAQWTCATDSTAAVGRTFTLLVTMKWKCRYARRRITKSRMTCVTCKHKTEHIYSIFTY